MFSSAAPSSIHNTEFQSPATSISAVNQRRRQHMKLLFLPLTLPHPNPPLQSTKISCLYRKPRKPYIPIERPRKFYTPIIRPSTPPRDVVIDFGKHKGKMLGSIPSAYLKWVSKNLRSAEFEKWAELADQVLEDPIYKERIEWEFADRILTGDSGNDSRSSEELEKELREVSERFNWDLEEDADWSKVNFKLLGTSFGGRIPRIGPNGERTGPKREAKARIEKARAAKAAAALDEGASARVKRRERMRSKRIERSSEGRSRLARLGSVNGVDDSDEKIGQVDDSDDKEIGQDRTAEVVPMKFPGRISLWKKAIDLDRLS